ncbi:hypothetical protein L9F63_027950, partial [Diploptera punctata]
MTALRKAEVVNQLKTTAQKSVTKLKNLQKTLQYWCLQQLVNYLTPGHLICHNKSGEINPIKISCLVEAYVKKYRYAAKKKALASGKTKPKQHFE